MPTAAVAVGDNHSQAITLGESSRTDGVKPPLTPNLPYRNYCTPPRTRVSDGEAGGAARTPRGQATGLPAPHCPKGRRGSGVKGGPQGRRLRREAPLTLEGRPGTLRAAPTAAAHPGAGGPDFALRASRWASAWSLASG